MASASSAEGTRPHSTQLVVNDIGPLSFNQLSTYFGQYGRIRSKNISMKKTSSKSEQGGPFNYAFIRYDSAADCSAALASKYHYIGGRRCNVDIPNSVKVLSKANSSGSAATSLELDFELFGNFPDFEGYRYLLANEKFGHVGDYAAHVYMSQNNGIPTTISDTDSVLDALIAAEDEAEKVLRCENAGNLDEARLHRAAHITLLAAVQEYSCKVNKDGPISWEKVAFVKKAPRGTTYRHIKEKFEGRVHDAWFQRRGAPDLSRSSGYYVVFATTEDVSRGYKEDGTIVIPCDSSTWWHKCFWLFFVRRTLLITATLSNVGLAAHCWRSSAHRWDREAAVAKVFAARDAADATDRTSAEDDVGDEVLPQVRRASPSPTEHHETEITDEDNIGGIAAAEADADIETTSDFQGSDLTPTDHLPSEATGRRNAQGDQELGTMTWGEQRRVYDLDAYFPDQATYRAYLDRIRKNKLRASNAVLIESAALRFDLAATFYQLYRSDAFLGPCGFGAKSKIGKKLDKIRECDRVSYGFVLDKCTYWYEKNPANMSQIKKFLTVTDRIFKSADRFGASLEDVWMGRDVSIRKHDDGKRYGDNTFTPPFDFSYKLVETAERLHRVRDHLATLTSDDDVAFDTEGAGDAYTAATVQTIQVATSRKKSFVIDMQYCVGLPEMAEIGAVLRQRRPLYFGMDFASADSDQMWPMLGCPPHAIPVHEIGRMVLKVLGMAPETAMRPSLSNIVEDVLRKELAKDAQTSGWNRRRRRQTGDLHLTDRQVLYAATDTIVIIEVLRVCKETFPNRYLRYRDNFRMLDYTPRFEYKNWNETDEDRAELPTLLFADDPPYTRRL